MVSVESERDPRCVEIIYEIYRGGNKYQRSKIRSKDDRGVA